jgi:hypothetical protein
MELMDSMMELLAEEFVLVRVVSLKELQLQESLLL